MIVVKSRTVFRTRFFDQIELIVEVELYIADGCQVMAGSSAESLDGLASECSAPHADSSIIKSYEEGSFRGKRAHLYGCYSNIARVH